jgi:hypothetical protein
VDTVGNVLLLVAVAVVIGLYLRFWFRTLQDIQRADLDPSARGLWTLAILFLQFFGPLAWWSVGPGTRHSA